MSRREYRAVYTVLRVDPAFLPLSKDAKLYWHTAKLELPVSGIGVCLPHTIAGLASMTIDEAQAAEAELVAAGWMARSGAVLWIINGLRHTPSLSPADAKHRKHIAVLLADLPRENALVAAFRDYYAEWFDEPAAPPPTEGASEGPTKGHPEGVGSKEEGRRKKESPSPSPSADAREAELAERLETDADRNALTALLRSVDAPGPWLAEIGAHLDGLHPPQLTPAQAGEALRDFVGNGGLRSPNLKHFRGYLRNAGRARDRPSRTNGRRPTPQTFEYTPTTTLPPGLDE